MKYRAFWTLNSLSKGEEEKLRQFDKRGGDRPDIKYRRRRVVETIEADSISDVETLIEDREMESVPGMMEFRKFAEVFAVAEYREGESTARLDSYFTAEDRDLIPE